MAGAGLVSRGLTKVRELVASATHFGKPPEADDLDRIRTQLQEWADGRGGEVSTRQRAGRHAFLKLIAHEFGPDPRQVASAHEAYQAAIGTPGQWDAEARLRAALRSRRLRILTQFNAIPQGVKFLVDLRADLLRFINDDPQLKPLDRELEARLSA